jgi:hypothetical protein
MDFAAYLCGERGSMTGMTAFFKNFAWKFREGEREKKEKKEKRIEITMGITCHTCHGFGVFGFNKRFTTIPTCHPTCHVSVMGERC